MKRKRCYIIFMVVVYLFFSMFVSGNAQDISIEAKSAVLIDGSSGEILFEQNKDEKLPPASITKIMTMLLTMEAIDTGKITMEDKVSISQQASDMGGTQLYIEPSETRTVEELLTGIAVESANDAACALGEYIGGTHEAFIKLMNDKAKELGMKNTNFKNTNGLPEDDHYTTAYDTALMSKELVKYQDIHKYLTMWMVDITVGKNDDRTRTLANTNKLLKDYQGLDGIKTGYTTEAKHCLSATAKRGELRLISVILSADSSKERFEETAKLLDYGFANYEGLNVVKKGEEIKEISIEKGVIDKTKVIAKNDLSILVRKGENSKIEKKIILDSVCKAPIEKEQKLGELIAYADNQELGRVDLVSSDRIEQANFLLIFKKIVRDWVK